MRLKLIFSSLILFSIAYPLLANKHEALSKNSLTVGCNGQTCPLVRTLYRLQNGFYKDVAELLYGVGIEKSENGQKILNAIKLKQKALGTHDHPGTTIDLEPKAETHSGEHIQGDWLTLDLKDEFYDAIFFEQFPATGIVINPSGEVEDKFPKLLPHAINKAHTHLIADGRLIVQLALDYRISPKCKKEQLQELRTENPFMGHFNDITEIIKRTALSNPHRGPASVLKGLDFYKKTISRRLSEMKAFVEEATDKEAAQIVDIFYNALNMKLAYENMTGMEAATKNLNGAAGSLLSLMVIFRQGEMMVNWLNENGFKDAQLEWLEADDHEYHNTAGWFLTATKDTK